jgi:hypothetical protein
MKHDFLVVVVITVLLGCSAVGCVGTDLGEPKTADGMATHCTDRGSEMFNITMKLL